MEFLLIEEQIYRTPKINFDPEKGRLEIAGMSCHENARIFYSPVLEWISRYISAAPQHTELNIRLKYFNTNTAKCLLDMLEKLMLLKKNNNMLDINWYYQDGDEDMQETAQTFGELIDHKINIIRS